MRPSPQSDSMSKIIWKCNVKCNLEDEKRKCLELDQKNVKPSAISLDGLSEYTCSETSTLAH